jgi:hypothetical protein
MNLCKHCGVEVEDDARYCPLCRNPLQPGTEGEQREAPPPPPVPKAVSRSMRRWLLEVFTLLGVTGAIVVFAADFSFGMSLTWARFPLASIAFLWLAAVLLILGWGRVWVSLVAEVAAVGLFLFVLDGLTQGSAWFFPLALPLTLLAGTILALTLAIVRVLDLSPFPTIATAMSAAAVLVVGLELLLNRYLADRWFVSWSAVAFACTLPLVLLLFYLRKRFKPMQAEMRKRLHL